MILGIIITVLGIFGVVVFLYLAYKTAKTPIENEKDKVMRLLDKSKKITNQFTLNTNYSYLDEVPDETSYLFEDKIEIEDQNEIYKDSSYDEETAFLDCEETEFLDS